MRVYGEVIPRELWEQYVGVRYYLPPYLYERSSVNQNIRFYIIPVSVYKAIKHIQH